MGLSQRLFRTPLADIHHAATKDLTFRPAHDSAEDRDTLDQVVAAGAGPAPVAAHSIHFKFALMVYSVGISLFGASLICLIEIDRTNINFWEAFFMAVNATTCTGLTIFNLTALSGASQFVVGLVVQCSSSVLVSAAPLTMRYWGLRQALTKKQRKPPSDDLNEVPKYVIELNSMWIIIKSILIYHLIVYSLGFLLLLIAMASLDEADRGICGYEFPMNQTGGYPCSPAPFALFFTVSAFNNAGFGLDPNSLIDFRNDPLILTTIAFLLLAGNVVYPVLLRALLWAMSWFAKPNSWDNVYHAHIRLQGRKLYQLYFGRKQLAILLFTQVCLFIFQLAPTYVARAYHKTNGKEIGCDLLPWPDQTMDAYMSIQTRHAGFTTVNLAAYPPLSTYLFVLGMALAPIPLMVAVHESSLSAETILLKQQMAEEARKQAEALEREGEEQQKRLAEAKAKRLEGPEGSQQLSAKEMSLTVTESVTSAARKSKNAVASFVTASHGHINKAVSKSTYTDLQGQVTDLQGQVTDLQGQVTDQTARLATVCKAAAKTINKSLVEFLEEQSMSRDLTFFAIMWFSTGASVMYCNPQYMWSSLFELSSAFGNVGLSLGALTRDAPAGIGFSWELGPWGQVCVLLVALYGRTRTLPKRADYSLVMVQHSTIDETQLEEKTDFLAGAAAEGSADMAGADGGTVSST